MHVRRILALVVFSAILAGCADTGKSRPTPPIPTPGSPPRPIDLPCVQTSHGCYALNPDVTQATIAQTICVAGYTASIRPATSYTNGIKVKLLRDIGQDAWRISDYELDHIVPLALGGHPRKLSNLTLQPWQGDDSAKTKDVLERRLQRMVCDHAANFDAAQFCIAENWRDCAASIAAGRLPTSGNVVAEMAPPLPTDQPAPKAIVAAPVPGCAIKGNVSKRGRIYHIPGSPQYEQTVVDESQGERWFCTEQEAQAAGWRAPLH